MRLGLLRSETRQYVQMMQRLPSAQDSNQNLWFWKLPAADAAAVAPSGDNSRSAPQKPLTRTGIIPTPTLLPPLLMLLLLLVPDMSWQHFLVPVRLCAHGSWGPCVPKF